MPTTDWLNSLEDRGEPEAEDEMTEDADDYAVLRARHVAHVETYGNDDIDEMPF
jgi:hypothetical protein